MSTHKRNKPLFRKKNQMNPVIKTILLIILLIALVAVGFMLGEPLLSLIEPKDPPVINETPDNAVTDANESEITTTPATTEEQVTTTAPPEPEKAKNGILALSFVGSDNFEKTLDEAIAYALDNNYNGIMTELVANGGTVYFATANELANSAEAVALGALPLEVIYTKVSDAGLVPYAEVSALSDHIASWMDRSLCYLFEDGSSKWLDNSVSKGGKPWISAFSQNARKYISSFVTEISEAGFAGVVASDVIFPPFRNTDLNYIGNAVKSSDRYIALVEFTGSMNEALGAAKSFSIAVDAKDVILGEAEILTDTSILTTKTVYVYYDSLDIGEKLVRDDGTAVSFAGLSEYHKVKTVFNLVKEALGDKDVLILPAIKSDDPESLIQALVEIGFKQDDILTER